MAPDPPAAAVRASLPRRRAWSAAAAVAAALISTLGAGCAGIPTEGPVKSGRDVSSGQEASDPYVRVFAEPPRGGENVYQIVEGFLEASGTVEADYATARAYLAPVAGRSWRPRFRISVYDHNDVIVSQPQAGLVEFAAQEVGSVDDQGGFTAAEPGQKTRATFRLARVSGEWRIVDMPPGLYVSQQDFEREYRALDLYYFDPDRRVLVPDPVFLPVGAGLATALTKALIQGPSRWLATTTVSELPSGTVLDGESVDVDNGVANVRLSERALAADLRARERMIAQLVSTLMQVPEVSAVRVSAGGTVLSTDGGRSVHEAGDVSRYEPVERSVAQTGYYLRGGRLYSLGPTAMTGPLGDGNRPISAAAASPDGAAIAAVSADRRTLWTAQSSAPASLRVRGRGQALHSPSYDQFGNLWVVDGDGVNPAVRWLPVSGDALPVVVPQLGGASVPVLRVSDDGTRLALVAVRDGRSEVLVGVVQREPGRLVVSQLRRMGHRLLSARGLAWAEADRLVVLAAEARTQLQPYYVSLDGAHVEPGEPLAGIASIAAAPGQPLLAATTDRRVWRLRPDGPWVQVAPGEYPLYPG